MEDIKKPEFGTRETGMFVPDGFFAEFQRNLEKQIDLEVAKKKERHIVLRRWSIAASICLLLGLAPLAWSLFGSDKGEQPAQQQDETLVAEIETEVEDMDSDEIMVSSISDLDIYELFYANL